MANSVLTIKVFDKIYEEIRHRYASESIVRGALDNHAIHQFFQKKDFKILKKYKTFFNPNILVIIPNLSQVFPIPYTGRKVDTVYHNKIIRDYCVKTTGIDPLTSEGKREIQGILKSIQAKEMKLAIIGYGGAMINFLWNVYVLAFLSNFNEPIFKELVIFEKEAISFTNILRLGKPVLLESYINIYLNDSGTLNKLNLIREEFQLAEEVTLVEDYLTDEEDLQELVQEDFIFIGAPNFKARKLLEDTNFFFFGHANNELEIFYQPLVNTELTFESYGSIDIPVLLSNIAAGTIEMLRIFAGLDTKNTDYEKSESLFRIDYGEVMLERGNAEKSEEV
jgi:hypothetical protein